MWVRIVQIGECVTSHQQLLPADLISTGPSQLAVNMFKFFCVALKRWRGKELPKSEMDVHCLENKLQTLTKGCFSWSFKDLEEK